MRIKGADIFEQIDERKKERAEKLEELHANLAKAKSAEKSSKENADKAIISNDVKRYAAAKEAERAAADQIDFFSIQIENHKKQPLFTDPEERSQKFKEVRAYVETSNSEKLEKAAALLLEADELVEAARVETIKANYYITDLAKGTGKNIAKIDVLLVAGLARSISEIVNHKMLEPYKNK